MKKITNKVLSLVVGLSMLIPSAVVLADDTATAPKISATETTTLSANACKVSVNNMTATDSVINTATWDTASDVTLAFEVPEEKAYTLTIENISRASHSAVGEMVLQFDNDATQNIATWDKKTENGEIGTWGVPSALSYKTMVLSKGVHTLKISCTDTSIGGARIAVGKLTFEPFADLNLSANETTTINTKDYLVYAKNFSLNGNNKIISDQANGTAELTIPFKVTKENVYKITIDNVSKAANTGISALRVNLDGTEYSDTYDQYVWKNEGAGKLDWQVRGVLSSKSFLLSEGDHTIKLYIDAKDGTGRYRGAIGEISFAPAETAVVSTSEETTLNAADFIAYAKGAVSKGNYDGVSHIKFEDKTNIPSVKIPFKTNSFGSYEVSVDTCSKVSNDAMSPVFVRIDDGEWEYTGNWTVKGNGIASNFGAGASKIVSKKGIVLEAGDHSIEFKITEKTADSYRGTVGNILFTPNTSEETSVNAAAYADGKTGYGKHSTNTNIAITYGAPGTLKVPVTVYKAGYYTINMDLLAKMNEGETFRSWMYLGVDNGDPVKLTSGNTTLVAENVDSYPDIASLNNYKYNNAQYFEPGVHYLTFSTNEISQGTENLYITAIKNITVKKAERYRTLSIPARITDFNVTANPTKISPTLDGTNISDLDLAAVSFKSSNEKVATVDQSGTITFVGMGETEIEVAVRQFANDTAEEELKASVTYHVYENGLCIYGASKTDNGVSATLKTNAEIASNKVYAAKYDSTGKLTGVAIVNSGEIAKKQTITLNAEFGAVGSEETAKFFVWDSNLKPLVKSVEF